MNKLTPNQIKAGEKLAKEIKSNKVSKANADLEIEESDRPYEDKISVAGT